VTDLNPLTIEKFRRWLYTRRPEQDIGCARSLCRCPLAAYLREGHGYPHPEVMGDYVRARHGSIRWKFSTPTWAEEFIEAVDVHRPRHLKQVTAREALAYLRQIEEDMGC
jgi:hypothetical protein